MIKVKRILKSLRHIKNRRGQSLVELALILPIIVLLLFGTVEFGRVFHSYINITSAVREGARLGAVGRTDIEIEDRIRESVTLANADTQLSILKIYPVESARTPGIPVEIEIQYDLPLVTPLLGDILPNPVPLKASATMRHE